MRGLIIEAGQVEMRDDLPRPEKVAGESRVRVTLAGVCATDLALLRGYMGFQGVPGHEFVGVALEGPLEGRRVVGEINAACGDCERCRAGLMRHCARRSVLGILGRPGAFAEELRLPQVNLRAVPDSVPDEAAVFTEPLAAAFEIAEQLELDSGLRTLVIGDGRLGILCAQALAYHGLSVLVAGRHSERAPLLPASARLATGLFEAAGESPREEFDLVVEASGNPALLERAIAAVVPRGTLVMKTTTERANPIDMALAVVNEIRIIGSRCGPFAPALRALEERAIPVEGLISERYSLAESPLALERAGRGGVLKVLIDVS